MRLAGCCLPPCPNRIAIPGSVSFAAQSLPAPSPVNASPPLLRAPPHDSGSLWLARPLTYDSFIHYNLPVYPGALGHYRKFVGEIHQDTWFARFGFFTLGFFTLRRQTRYVT